MSESRSPIIVIDGATGQDVEAYLCQPIGETHIADTERHWRPWLSDALARMPNPIREESAHWDWRSKMKEYGGQLGFPSFAIEFGGVTQGLMLLNMLESCRLDMQRGKPLAYVEYLVTAPWNRASLTTPRYKSIGSIFMGIAIHLSLEEGFDGRIGLHSLPQSCGWYTNKCGMTDLGIDPQKPPLRYFEMTPRQAKAFLS